MLYHNFISRPPQRNGPVALPRVSLSISNFPGTHFDDSRKVLCVRPRTMISGMWFMLRPRAYRGFNNVATGNYRLRQSANEFRKRDSLGVTHLALR